MSVLYHGNTMNDSQRGPSDPTHMALDLLDSECGFVEAVSRLRECGFEISDRHPVRDVQELLGVGVCRRLETRQGEIDDDRSRRLVIDTLRRFHDETHKTTLSSYRQWRSEQDGEDLPSLPIITRLFGSWGEACVHAWGHRNPSPAIGWWSEDDLLDALDIFVASHGMEEARSTDYRTWCVEHGKPTMLTLSHRLGGTWKMLRRDAVKRIRGREDVHW